ncbi:MAG: hypothetical protein QM767_10525 [Anaeromyxobacter sp.]
MNIRSMVRTDATVFGGEMTGSLSTGTKRSARASSAVARALVLCLAFSASDADAVQPAVTVYSGNGCVSGDGTSVCCEAQGFTCEGIPLGDVGCRANGPGCGYVRQCDFGVVNSSACTPGPQVCAPPKDNDNVDATLGMGCASPAFPFAGQRDPHAGVCGRARFNELGADPILVSGRAAATAPFTDLSVDRVSKLSLTRAYNSADRDLAQMGAGGSFGNAWHHDWEATLSCVNGICTVARGTLGYLRFRQSSTALSLDGSETLAIYTGYSSAERVAHHDVLVRHASGDWDLHSPDGRTFTFRSTCTTCDSSSSQFCQPAETGGVARLVKVTNPAGDVITVSYWPEQRVPLALADDLGHALKLTSPTACGSYATELRYDDVLVATYSNAGNQLTKVSDADGRVMRSYAYVNAGAYWPRIQGVMNESGALIAEFSYDENAQAVGLVDDQTTLDARYSSGCVAQGGNAVNPNWMKCSASVTATETFRGPAGDEEATSSRSVNAVVWFHSSQLAPFGIEREGATYAPVTVESWLPNGDPMVSYHESYQRDGRSYGTYTYNGVDALGRTTHLAEFSGVAPTFDEHGGVPRYPGIPILLGQDSYEEWRAYGLSRTVAQGVTVPLDTVTRIWRLSTLMPGEYTEERFDYDQTGKAADPIGYVCAPDQLPAGSVLCRTVSSGYVTTQGGVTLRRYGTFYSYDSRGRLTRTVGPFDIDSPYGADDAPVEERFYWSEGDTAARQGRLAEIRRYANPASPPLATRYDYDLFGPSEITAPNGTKATIARDGRGRPTFITYADAAGTARARTETRYYDGMLPRLIILPDGSAQRFGYDERGREASVEYLSGDPEASGGTVTTGWSQWSVYDGAGNVIHSEMRNASGQVTWQQDRAYDAHHHAIWESNPSAPELVRTWTFTRSGFLTGTVDEEGRAVSFEPDGLLRVAAVTQSGLDGKGAPVTTQVAGYERVLHQDQIGRVTDGAGHSTTYQYDDFGRTESVTSQTSGTVRYEYDARGNVVGRSNGSTTWVLLYDGLDRLTSLQVARDGDATTIHYQYGYDRAPFQGRLTSVSEPDRTTYLQYDWAGRVASEVRYEAVAPVPFTTQYDYDLAGRLRLLSYPSGLSIQYDRDPASGYVTAVKDARSGASLAYGIMHYPGGPLAQLTFASGLTLVNQLNLRYEFLSVKSGPLSLTLAPTPAGDVGQVTERLALPSCEQRFVRGFGYDYRERLTSWQDLVDGTAGTCPRTTGGASSAGYAYVANTDRVASGVAEDGDALSFDYDADGNVSGISQQDPGGSNHWGVPHPRPHGPPCHGGVREDRIHSWRGRLPKRGGRDCRSRSIPIRLQQSQSGAAKGQRLDLLRLRLCGASAERVRAHQR